MSTNDRPLDPYVGFMFTVEVSPPSLPVPNATSTVGGFSDVSGLNFETEVETLRVGGINDTEWMLAGASKFPTRLTLKRGLADRSFFWDWYLAITKGQIVRRELTIAMRDSNRQGLHSWSFKAACPVKWTGPELRASNSAIGFESIELVHRGLLRSQ
jgi:phage tail-like protein